MPPAASYASRPSASGLPEAPPDGWQLLNFELYRQTHHPILI